MPQKKGQVKGQQCLTTFFSPNKVESATSSKPAKKVEPEHKIGTAVKIKVGNKSKAHATYKSGKIAGFNGISYSIKWDATGKTSKLSPQETAHAVQVAPKIGTRVEKEFPEQGFFQGLVVDITHADDFMYYYVLYDDGDEEEIEQDEFDQCRETYISRNGDSKPAPTVEKEEEEEKIDDPTIVSTSTTSSNANNKRQRRRVQYNEESGDDDDDGDGDFGEPAPKSKRKVAKKRKVLEDDLDDEEFEMGAASDDESLPDDMDVDDESEASLPKKTTARAKAKQTKGKEAKAEETEADIPKEVPEGWTKDPEFWNRLNKERKNFKPNNNPQKWPTGAYVDPVGIDPTHGIVEGIITEQVGKVGRLLQMVAAQDGANGILGELGYPIKLMTACSGTDAPSIALGLVQECYAKLQSSQTFEYSHEMSCEIEPFKQAYIGRNFPGVPLFPDINKLIEPDVKDVYGRSQAVPDGNLFVAGTSCKDFSMLKTTYRKDIEDKGTSGQTFLSAVEFLEQKQPRVAIFENVDGAPWSKMQEYITGRVSLEDRNVSKNIVGASGDADKKLIFSVNDDGMYVAEEIPRQVGIRAGAIVRGFVKQGNHPNDIVPLRTSTTTKKITLGELAKKHKINLDGDTLVLDKKARYCTHLCKLDTKEYGLPQTRNRKYLFIWRSDEPDDDLGEYFQEILDHLKTPLLHSMDAFLLPDTHDRIRCFREALRSGPGLMVKRERAKEEDFWDWDKSKVKDLAVHRVFREANGLAERSRWLTGWGTLGRKSLAPGLWPELVHCWNHRRLDLIDCFSGAAVRDAISRDPMHHAFTWDLSQNVTRAPFRSATCGVSGCVTPGGELLLPYRGRSVMGYEKLLLQGIPFSRLILGPETEVQLSDLAGNAMSVPVINATMLAAICAPQLRRQRETNKKVLLTNFAFSQKYATANGAVLAERGDMYDVPRDTSAKTFVGVFSSLLGDFARDAYRTSVLCYCESSGTVSTAQIMECCDCGMSVCRKCCSEYQVHDHDLKPVENSGAMSNIRPDPHEFERKLRSKVPSVLRLSEGWEEVLKDGDGLESFSFQLQEVRREKGHWQLLYGAWEDQGRGKQVAEIRVLVGRIKKLDPEYRIAAYIRCYAPAIRHKNPYRGKLKDAARIELSSSSNQVDCWEVPISPQECTINLVGSEEVESQRVLIGLNDDAARALKSHDVKNAFKPPIDSRNHLTHYHSKWKTWPGTIKVSGSGTGIVNGIYRKTKCTHTIVLSALWKRDGTCDKPAMYLFFRPDVLRTQLDTAVFSLSPSYKDTDEVFELDDWIPENTLLERTHKTSAKGLTWKPLASGFTVEVPKPRLNVLPMHDSFDRQVSNLVDPTKDIPILCTIGGLSTEITASVLEYTSLEEAGDVVNIDLFGKAGTRNAKRLSIIAAPSLLKCAAEGNLPLTLSKWYKLPKSIVFGHCPINVPSRPVGRWRRRSDRDNIWEREYDNEESNDYYHRLFHRPKAFSVEVDRSQGTMTLKMNPYVAAHRAAAQLGGEETGSVEVDYCLSELSSMGEPPTTDFHVPNSDRYTETIVGDMELPLYKRQAKALTRMQAIENGEVLFPEEERSEIVLPGIGWCLIAKAAKHSPLRGGVLGDAIGSGKTVVTIALILAGAEKARSRRNVETGRSGASLIVVPPGLVQQWDDERKKFTKNKLRCIRVDSTSALMKFSVEDFCNADVVIVPAGLIEEAKGKKRPYTENLSKKARAGSIPQAPTYYSQREAPTIEGTWVRNMSSGPEIYVGNKGKQKDRDSQAYYGHCYSEAIKKLREKKFAPSQRGVPIEYFTWERIIIDECHETLVTGKGRETNDADFKATARRGAREFLGVAETSISNRPLIAETGVWGLTGTPLLETEARVTELANLMGGTYLTGASNHWRKEERESGRDLFLNQQEATRSREYRCAVQQACHRYVKEACQRNRGEALQVKLTRKNVHVNMSESEGKDFQKLTNDIDQSTFDLSPGQLGEKAGDVLSISCSSKARHSALLGSVDAILEKEPGTKIIVFANTSFGGYASALKALESGGKRYCHVSDESSVEEQNETISWFRHVDVSEAERQRPRILLLSFEQAAGHNLQEACHNVIIYDPYYSGSDAVADASVEEQAVGRVMRQGQKRDVTVTRILVSGPKGERCLDDWIMERNLDEKVLQAATSNFD
ncbi:unnamed protein product [Cylindrotheca closterium]|uniref:Helicase ATP-binding domain-containing protein n=1 Tax=Cylindrotheca closterium TaxID=2856 RepID=A0AAD2CM76_9STRA|nr:unnamed protein product [Cylindrotheca closterium]